MHMIRLLGFLVALLIVAAVIGYSRGWFYANAKDVNDPGSFTVTVDKDKLNKDKAAAEQRLMDLEHK
jgi:hypothetical protein